MLSKAGWVLRQIHAARGTNLRWKTHGAVSQTRSVCLAVHKRTNRLWFRRTNECTEIHVPKCRHFETGENDGRSREDGLSSKFLDMIKANIKKGDGNIKWMEAMLYVAVIQGDADLVQHLLRCGESVETKTWYGFTPLLLAAAFGKEEIVSVFVKSGANINAANMYGNTALIMAAMEGNKAIVEFLLTEGADVNSTNLCNQTALCAAAFEGHIEVAELLITAKADLNTVDSKCRTALNFAAAKGHFEVVKILLESGAEIDVKDYEGSTALYSACFSGHRNVVDLLVRAGADAAAVTTQGSTALMAAAHNGHLETVKDLLGSRINVNVKRHDGLSALSLAAYGGHVKIVEALIDSGAEVDSMDNDGRSAIHAACHEGHGHVVDILLQAGADVKEERGFFALMVALINGHYHTANMLLNIGISVQGYSPLQFACMLGSAEYVKTILEGPIGYKLTHTLRPSPVLLASQIGQKEVLDLLLGAGFSPNGEAGETPLVAAVFNCHEEVVRKLLNSGADVNKIDENESTLAVNQNGHTRRTDLLLKREPKVQNNMGCNALHAAAFSGQRKILEILISAGADPNIKTKFGQTPLMLAANTGHADVLKSLLKAGASLEERNANGETALCCAVHGAQRHAVDVLLAHNANVEATDYRGETPLLTACAYGHMEIAAMLVNYGANVNARNDRGNTPLSLAAPDHPGLVDLLIKAGAILDVSEQDGMTPLLVASFEGNDMAVRSLLKAGADVNEINEQGNSPLLFASDLGNIDVVHTLLNHGADIDAKNKDGVSAVRVAARNGHADIVRLLLLRGATGDYKTMQESVANGHTDVVRLLLDCTREEIKNEIRLALLEEAILNNHQDIVQLLIGTGRWLKTLDETRTHLLLMQASHKRALAIFQLVFNAGVPIRMSKDRLKPPLVDYGWSELSVMVMAKSTGSLDVYRTIMILLFKHGVFPLDNDNALLFQNVIDYGFLGKGFSVQEYSLGDLIDIQQTPSPRLDIGTILKCPGLGSAQCIPKHKAKSVTDFVNEKVQNLVTRFNDQQMFLMNLHWVGSAAEGTNVGLPDEIDYLMYSNVNFESVELQELQDGYIFCRKKGKDRVTTKAGENLSWFCCGSKRFHDNVYRALAPLRSDFKDFIEDMPMVKDGGHASTELTGAYVDPKTSEQMRISIDLVPVIHFPNSWPDKGIQRTWMMDTQTLKARGFALVAKPPHKKSKLGKSMAESHRVQLWRLSCSHLETEHIANLEQRVKDAYITAKCLRSPDVCRYVFKDGDEVIRNADKYISSYLLKTVFLHRVEEFLENDLSLLHMVCVIYEDLVKSLEQGVLPLFWQRDVNVFEGLSVDIEESLRVARLLRKCLESQRENGSGSENEQSTPPFPECGYLCFDLNSGRRSDSAPTDTVIHL